jgi:hypothetical protein
MQNYKLEREVKKQLWLGAVHSGDESLHWTVVPSKKKKMIMSVCSPSLYEKHMHSIVICNLLGSAIFFHIMS